MFLQRLGTISHFRNIGKLNSREQYIRTVHNAFTPSTIHLPTIYALATPAAQKSAIAVIRISGSSSRYIYHRLTRRKKDPTPRMMMLRNLYKPTKDNLTKNLLDQSLVSLFPGPQSFTGEDTLELYIHGGTAVAQSVLESIGKLNDRSNNINIRYAEAGEFSKRAFQNQKFDLTEVEGIRDLIDAETESQRNSVLCSFNGSNKKLFENWRKQLVNNEAQLTAVIDFGDDNDIDSDNYKIFSNVESSARILKKDIEDFVTRVDRANLLQRGLKLALIGEPNVGKSSLLNILAKDDVSIVSNIPGTTRDTIDRVIDLDGYKVIFCDTAGIRGNTDDEIEQIGIERATLKGERSDVCVIVVDASKGGITDPKIIDLVNSETFKEKPLAIVLNKIDLLDSERIDIIMDHLKNTFKGRGAVLPVSCNTGEGIEILVTELIQTFKDMALIDDQNSAITVSQRIREILHNDVLYGLDAFLMSKKLGNDLVMASEDLKYAIDGIGKITGSYVGVEEVLGVVFSTFCVGK
ncbi:similar to Saccharomyces cerevisiae YMR023C MSS1 Mitochondrial protein [Maudiozyma saulgeensis]|uniref:Similar to Saccharomyces cerevisiae YMR023C MSS1 Mitochondrial protein n=1 Tax=Maudiozyma saulgeensis TaxID=1789683 RepID=A0A1X7R8I7_9SACH|nr:similar to Saccharomyces cerevisiae YMR023C MSS1 Mitochondrial protein [Kazachstania saulgeensis]